MRLLSRAREWTKVSGGRSPICRKAAVAVQLSDDDDSDGELPDIVDDDDDDDDDEDEWMNEWMNERRSEKLTGR